MRQKSIAAIITITFIALIITAYGNLALAQVQIASIQYYAVYDPVENEGLLEVAITVNCEKPSWLSVPINVFGDLVELSLQNYSYTGDLIVSGLDYAEEHGVMETLVYGKGTIYLYFTIKDLIEEVGVGAFELYADTTVLANFAENVILEVIVPGKYEIESTTIRGDAKLSVLKEQKSTRLRVDGIGEYTIMLYTYLEEPAPPDQYWWRGLIYIAVPAIVGPVTIIAIYYILRKRRVGIVVERVDYTDNTTRAILKALREAGNKGLTQAEIVKLTSLPKSSVSRRIRRLEEEGFVEVKRVGKYSIVYLTSKGLELSKRLLEKGGR